MRVWVHACLSAFISHYFASPVVFSFSSWPYLLSLLSSLPFVSSFSLTCCLFFQPYLLSLLSALPVVSSFSLTCCLFFQPYLLSLLSALPVVFSFSLTCCLFFQPYLLSLLSALPVVFSFSLTCCLFFQPYLLSLLSALPVFSSFSSRLALPAVLLLQLQSWPTCHLFFQPYLLSLLSVGVFLYLPSSSPSQPVFSLFSGEVLPCHNEACSAGQVGVGQSPSGCRPR